jgi:flagellar hook-basal body complex protein FliE
MLDSIMGGGGGGNIFGMVGGIVGGIFGGPLGAMIGKAIGNMAGEAVGQAMNQVVDTLQKENGMPGFLKDEIKQMVKDEVAKLKDDSVDCECQQQVNDDMQSSREDFIKDLVKMILDFVKQAMQQQGGEESGSASGSSSGGSQKPGAAGGSQGSGGAGNLMNQIAMDGAEAMGETGEGGKKKSWYEALSEALGKVLDAQAEKIKGLSDKVSGMSEDDSDKPSVMTELQSASQKMSFLMSAANDVLKTIGQALGEMARKQ